MSRATEPPEVVAITLFSERNNSRDGVTGLLVCDSARYLHILEGPREPVEACFARIEADPRHRQVDVLIKRDIKTRNFDGFQVLCNTDGTVPREAYLHSIKQAVRCIREPELQALFIGFGFMAGVSRGVTY